MFLYRFLYTPECGYYRISLGNYYVVHVAIALEKGIRYLKQNFTYEVLVDATSRDLSRSTSTESVTWS